MKQHNSRVLSPDFHYLSVLAFDDGSTLAWPPHVDVKEGPDAWHIVLIPFSSDFELCLLPG